MTSLSNVFPGSTRQWDTVVIESGSINRQVARGAWPINKNLTVRKVMITSTSGLAGVASFWDQDLSNTVQVGRGSATAPILSIAFGPAITASGSPTTVVYGENDLPAITFEAGIAVSVSAAGVVVSTESEKI